MVGIREADELRGRGLLRDAAGEARLVAAGGVRWISFFFAILSTSEIVSRSASFTFAGSSESMAARMSRSALRRRVRNWRL